MLAGVAPSLDIGQARLCPDPRQLWHVPSGGWEGAMWALGLAKQALRLAQRAWPVFGQTLACAQTGLQHHIISAMYLNQNKKLSDQCAFIFKEMQQIWFLAMQLCRILHDTHSILYLLQRWRSFALL
jgi:hypothetical protein